MKKGKKVVLTIVVILLVAIIAALAVFQGEARSLLGVKANTETGVYEVNYAADYKLNDLLNQGGVTNEDELVQYILKVMLKGLPIKVPYEVPQLACSTFIAKTPEEGYIFGRNLDNQQTDLAVVKTAPKDGYKSVSVVNLSFLGYTLESTPEKITNRINMLALPYFPLDGVNEKGLAVGVLQIFAPATNQETENVDVDTTLAIRVLLDKAATVDEAVELLKGMDMHASAKGCYHLQIADAQGNSAIVEYPNNEITVLKKDGSYQCATNFYISDVDFDYEPGGMDRYEGMVKELTKKDGILTAEEGMGLLNTVSIKGTDPDEEGRVYSTQWSSIYDLTNPALNICVDRDYENTYTYTVD